MQTISTYEQNALKIAEKLGVSLEVKFLRHGKHFEDDKESRDIYECTLKRGSREYKFNFGQSIMRSGEYQVKDSLKNTIWCEKTTGGKKCLTKEEFNKLEYVHNIRHDVLKNPNFKAPTMYDVLTCLQKYEVGSFEDFCSEFGYDSDSRKAERVYNAVKEEYTAMQTLFNDSDLEILQEIE